MGSEPIRMRELRMRTKAQNRQPRVFAKAADFNARVAANSEALETALKLVAPYPLLTHPEFVGCVPWFLPEALGREEVEKQIRHLAYLYFRNLHDDAASPRIADTLESFRALVQHGDGLARHLKTLQQSEIELLTNSIWPGINSETWLNQIIQRLPSVGFPAVKEEPYGSGVAWLEYLSKHTNWVISQLERHADRGGDTNTHRKRLATPAWNLIGHCWSFFECFVDREPTGTTDGLLHRFVCSIHHLVTGEYVVTKFAKDLKRLASLVRRGKILNNQFDILATSVPELTKDEFMLGLNGRRPQFRNLIPPNTLAAAHKLRSTIDSLRSQLQHGLNWDASKLWNLG